MGNLLGGGGAGGVAAMEKVALLKIETQRDRLLERQEHHSRQAARLLATAHAQKTSGNVPGALATMRRYAQTLAQIQTICGIVHNLDAHTHALETKMITKDTMDVMRQTAGTLARNTMTADAVDDAMMQSEEVRDELRAITAAMTAHDGQTDDDLLGMLSATGAGTPAAVAVEPPAMALAANDDEAFYSYLAAETVKLRLPDAPTKAPASVPPPYTPGVGVEMVM